MEYGTISRECIFYIARTRNKANELDFFLGFSTRSSRTIKRTRREMESTSYYALEIMETEELEIRFRLVG